MAKKLTITDEQAKQLKKRIIKAKKETERELNTLEKAIQDLANEIHWLHTTGRKNLKDIAQIIVESGVPGSINTITPMISKVLKTYRDKK